VLIRPIEPRDIEPVASLLSQLATEFIIGRFEAAAQEEFLRKNGADAIRKFLEGTHRYHVAEIDGALAGFIGVRENKHLYHLFVAKAAQRRGIARALWEHAKRECAANGNSGSYTVNSSDYAICVYERLGFRRDGPAKMANGIEYNPMKLEAES
jgi:ribosomal protein S18 acetylase RimI-like enzyme